MTLESLLHYRSQPEDTEGEDGAGTRAPSGPQENEARMEHGTEDRLIAALNRQLGLIQGLIADIENDNLAAPALDSRIEEIERHMKTLRASGRDGSDEAPLLEMPLVKSMLGQKSS